MIESDLGVGLSPPEVEGIVEDMGVTLECWVRWDPDPKDDLSVLGVSTASRLLLGGVGPTSGFSPTPSWVSPLASPLLPEVPGLGENNPVADGGEGAGEARPDGVGEAFLFITLEFDSNTPWSLGSEMLGDFLAICLK